MQDGSKVHYKLYPHIHYALIRIKYNSRTL